MPYGHNRQYLELIREAKKQRVRLSREQEKQIRRMYQELAAGLDHELKKYSQKSLSYRWIKDYAGTLKKGGKGLFQSIENNVSRAILSAAELNIGVEKTFWSTLCPALSERFSDVFSSIPRRVVSELMNGGIYRDFTGLSERIWDYKKQFDKDIGYIINQGIIAKKSAFDLAKDLEIYLNPKAARPFDWSKVYPHCHKTVDYNAQRLARTSVTHAYQLSFVRATKNNPFIEKYQWLSSNGGRTCEICRERNGKYFDKNALPLDHPNGMCTIIAIIIKSAGEIADELASWVNGENNPAIDKWLGYY